ncbi:urease accessory protein UreD [Metabacillus bambusae]|uniref:Urease accessory protein UreD n=1 Tax=Metabacillus bambusae TaxID=2795218 RepID=A0ABS3N8M1_9BACI|nr:urease accessory protein UreD [Metabacillus bambusae]MBO1514390.1 urease accessory protein UreD [Metabacillus bambusae]
MTYTGYLELEVGKKQDRSVITNSFFDGVLKITRPTYLDGGLPLLTLIHVGGGYVDGDTYKTEVIMHESSRLALTTQASTKVYKSPRFGVNQSMDYFLKPNSELYIKQDSLIPYKDANFTQNTNVYMSSSAVFYYTDIITPGWSEDGKHFQYKKVASKMKIYVDDELAVFDHQLLQPCEQLEKMLYLEGYTHIGTMFFLHPQINERIIEELREELICYKKVRFGISILNVKGMSVRILANSTPIIESFFTKCDSLLRGLLNNEVIIEWRKG